MSAVFVDAGPDIGAVWHFGEPVKEQRALAEGKAFANLGHLPALAIEGADRLTWIHSLSTQDVENLQPGLWKSGYILDPQGHLEFPLLLVDDGATLFIFTEISTRQGLLNFLDRMRFTLRVEVRDASTEVFFGVGGGSIVVHVELEADDGIAQLPFHIKISRGLIHREKTEDVRFSLDIYTIYGLFIVIHCKVIKKFEAKAIIGNAAQYDSDVARFNIIDLNLSNRQAAIAVGGHSHW